MPFFNRAIGHFKIFRCVLSLCSPNINESYSLPKIWWFCIDIYSFPVMDFYFNLVHVRRGWSSDRSVDSTLTGACLSHLLLLHWTGVHQRMAWLLLPWAQRRWKRNSPHPLRNRGTACWWRSPWSSSASPWSFQPRGQCSTSPKSRNSLQSKREAPSRDALFARTWKSTKLNFEVQYYLRILYCRRLRLDKKLFQNPIEYSKELQLRAPSFHDIKTVQYISQLTILRKT